MTEPEAIPFEQQPYFRDMLRLRSWDELLKDAGALVSPSTLYREKVVRLLPSRGSLFARDSEPSRY